MIIYGSKLHNAIVEGHKDHRIIMSLAIVGMAIDGESIIKDAKGFVVTYPTFIDDFRKLGAHIKTD